MIALCEMLRRQADLVTNSSLLENLIISECPIKFFPEEQHDVQHFPEGNLYCFFNLPERELVNYLESIEHKLTNKDNYEVKDSVTGKFIRARIDGEVKKKPLY